MGHKIDVYERLRKAEQSPAWNRAGAWVILRGSEYVGKILCKYPVDGIGPLEVFLWDWSEPTATKHIQRSTVSGCGYDKLAAAMDGLTFGNILLKDYPTDWKTQLRDGGYTLIQVI